MKLEISVIAESVKNAIKKIINSTRIPALIDIIFKPSLREALNAAPEAKKNWERLGLDKTWKYFAVAGGVVLIYLGKNALQFVIEIIAQFGAVALLGAIGYVLWLSLKK